MQSDGQHRITMTVVVGLFVLAAGILGAIVWLGRIAPEMTSDLRLTLATIIGGLVGFLSNQRGSAGVTSGTVEQQDVRMTAPVKGEAR